MSKTFIERLDEYIAYAGLNDNQVTRQCGITVGLINSARKRGRNLSLETIGKILRTYKELNAYWLLTGDGEMIIGTQNEGLESYLKKENEGLKKENKSLIREIGTLEGQLQEQKKASVPKDDNAKCAAASGSDLQE